METDGPRKRYKIIARYECNVCGWTPTPYEPEYNLCPVCGGNIQKMHHFLFEELDFSERKQQIGLKEEAK